MADCLKLDYVTQMMDPTYNEKDTNNDGLLNDADPIGGRGYSSSENCTGW